MADEVGEFLVSQGVKIYMIYGRYVAATFFPIFILIVYEICVSSEAGVLNVHLPSE